MGNEFVKRGLGTDSTCKLCSREEGNTETSVHLFRDCQIARRVWACSDLGIRIEGDAHIGIEEWIINWLSYLEKLDDAEDKIVKYLATLWCLWLTRNRALNSGKEESKYGEVDGRIREACQIREGRPHFVVGRRYSCTATRVMVDAGWKSVGEAAVGWIAYVDEGGPGLTRSTKIGAESGLQAEALGVRDVLRWAHSQGILHLEVNSDCLQLILQLAGLEFEHHLISGVISDMRLLFPYFHCLSFRFVPRRLNKVAHGLAKRAMSD
ncbi:uncharacterized protein LOC141589717 [Silene latifolia]|uniref:uncharacterized protein LOC141589717 n=1 Tax=Silene latifolia TaxID=37657 RepID=UPI003D782B45